ncbi:MAG: RNA polymerase sigma factor [Calditrichaeota bacterium]|nr:MAG: RNA polymerase sigma factor [Calditrichota bacterium]MBL1207025.1 RNA polymerase sigma factor [Calditrichota bacterium]NOG46852.1 RNA polymerase sigma factor [Calditrichota bacterium]
MNQSIDFRSIVEAHQEKVRNTCFRFVKNKEDADDVAQEVFIQVYESLTHFREEAELSTWIYRIAVNKSLDFIRKKKRKKRFAQLTSLFGFNEDNEEIILPADDNPQQDIEQKERKLVLDSALEQLPENQRTAITLSKYEGFSNKEIAEIMAMSISAVEALMHRAKKNLQKLLFNHFEKNIR